MSTVDPTAASNNSNSISSAATSASSMGESDFLNLLVTQLKNQDPLDPVKNQDFIAQLAQFNSLEQMINLNTNFSSMNTMQSLAQSANFIGKEVAWQDSTGASQTGVVSAIEVQNNVPMLVVNGNLLKISDVLAIASGT